MRSPGTSAPSPRRKRATFTAASITRSSARSLHQVGVCLSRTGKFADAQPWYERAVTEKEKGDVHGRIDHASLGSSLHQLGVCLSRTSKFAEAQPWFERAVADKEQGDAHGRIDHESLGLTFVKALNACDAWANWTKPKSGRSGVLPEITIFLCSN